MVFLRIVSSDEAKPITIIGQINSYAKENGMTKKNGAFFDKNGKYVGTMYSVGKMAGIDMQEGK